MKVFANLSYRKTARPPWNNGTCLGRPTVACTISPTNDEDVTRLNMLRGVKRKYLHNRSTLQAKLPKAPEITVSADSPAGGRKAEFQQE